MPQAFQGIAGRDKFLTDMAFVADLDQDFHDRPITDLLLVVKLGPPGVAGGVHVGDMIAVLANPADDVSVRDLNMINVEK